MSLFLHDILSRVDIATLVSQISPVLAVQHLVIPSDDQMKGEHLIMLYVSFSGLLIFYQVIGIMLTNKLSV